MVLVTQLCVRSHKKMRLQFKSTITAIALLGLLGLISSACGESLMLDPGRLNEAKLQYREHTTLSEYPYPVIHWEKAGLASGPKVFSEIKEKILYPLIIESEEPIQAIIVKFIHAERGQVGINVVWADGRVHGSFMEHNELGEI